MENKFKYSFSDEPVTKFCYDTCNKTIEVHFTGYTDLIQLVHFDTPCVLTIRDWSNAKSRILGESKYEYLDDYMGVFSMVYNIAHKGSILELTLDTLDNRYLELWFENPKIEFLTQESI